MSLDDVRNELNLELRALLTLIDMIDGISKEYPDYELMSNSSEQEYLLQQLKLATEAKEKLLAIFKN